MITTKTMYCSLCEKRKRPTRGDWYLSIENDVTDFLKIEETDHHNFGFTPHIITHVSTIGSTVNYTQLCAMDRCGIEIERDDKDNINYYDELGKPVVYFQGEYYHYNEKGILDVYPRDAVVVFKAKVIAKADSAFATIRNWGALISS